MSKTIVSLSGVHETLKGNSSIPQDPYIHVQPDPDSDDSRFYINRPVWRVNAMAHAMAQTARYRGNADEFYSVAEHCCLVASLMRYVTGGDPFEGLMHDATESILPDVSAPFKQLLPDLRAIEHRLDADLRQTFGLAAHKSQECIKADWLALFIEASQIVPERGADFVDPYGFRGEALDLREQGWRIQCLPWREAKHLWLGCYKGLKEGWEPPQYGKPGGFEEYASSADTGITTTSTIVDTQAHLRGHRGFFSPGRRFTPPT
jgi:hypothetical protein